jgi:tRNA threonylcarbamoyladenosine biosynthesis protein TsaB
LAIDTSGPSLGLAAIEEGAPRLERLLEAPRRQSESLAPLVESALSELGWAARSLDALALSLGPGSFTGLRVGLAFAKGLHFSTGCALIGIPTLAAWAEGSTGEVQVWLDARRGQVYRGRFRDGVELDSRMLALAEAEAGRGGVPVLGDALDPGARLAPARLARLGWARLVSGKTDEPAGLEPLYLRRPEAEILWEKLGRA